MASLRKRALASSASPMALMREREWGLACFQKRPVVSVRRQLPRGRLPLAIARFNANIESLAERLADPAAGVTGVTEGHNGVV